MPPARGFETGVGAPVREVRLRRAVAFLALGLALGCGGGARRAAPPHQPTALAVSLKGQHAGRVMVGRSIGKGYRLLGAGAAFPRTTRSLTAGLLYVDMPSNTRTTVTWSKETGPNQERTLVTQHAMLHGRGILFATARQTPVVSTGLYRVHVSTAGEERDALFVVGTASPKQRTKARSATASSSVVNPPAADPPDEESEDLESGGVVSDPIPDECARISDPKALRVCADWWNGTYADNSGKKNARQAKKELCSYSPQASVSQDTSQFGGQVSASASQVCANREMRFLADVNRDPSTAVAHGGENVSWTGDTCDLPGHSDLVGDTFRVKATAKGVSPGSDSLTLREFGPTPTYVASVPEGSVVKPGEEISIGIVALALGATRGIKSLVLSDSSGNEIAHAGRAAPAAACDHSLARFGIEKAVTYKVPSDPPPIIDLLLAAETFDGGKGSVPIRYSTRPTWSGQINFRVLQPVPSGKQIWTGSGSVIVAETGPNKLSGKVRLSWEQELDLSVCPSDTITPGTAQGKLSGRVDDQGMHLAVASPTSTPPTITPCPGKGLPAIGGSPLRYAEIERLLNELKPLGNGHYSASIDATDGSVYPYHVHFDVELRPGAGNGDEADSRVTVQGLTR